MKTILSLALSLLFTLNAFGQEKPYDKIGLFEKASADVATELKERRSALVQEGYESDLEFAERVSQEQESPELRQIADSIQTELEETTYLVDKQNTTITVSPFDRVAKVWNISVASRDPQVPISGVAVISIRNSLNMKNDFNTYSELLKSSHTTYQLSYQISIAALGRYQIINPTISLSDSTPLDSDETSDVVVLPVKAPVYQFSLATQNAPIEVKLPPPTRVLVAMDTTFPPMDFIDDNNVIAGFDVDLFSEVAHIANLLPVYKTVSWDSIFTGLRNNTYDVIISGVTITDERKQTLDFSNPYINAGQVFVVRKGEYPKAKLGDFGGLSVGAEVNTTGSMAVQQYPSDILRTYDDISNAFDDLVNHSVEAVVIDFPVACLYVRNPKFNTSIEIAGTPFTNEFYGIVVKMGNGSLLKKINDALETLTANGKLDMLKRKWLQ